MEPIVIFADASLGTRLVGGGLIMIAGIAFILVGINNIRTQTAQESGKRRTVNWLLGRSNTYGGNTAVMMGVVRIIGGILGIGFGILFMIFGEFVAGPEATRAADQRRPGVGDEPESVRTPFDAWQGVVEQQQTQLDALQGAVEQRQQEWFAEQRRRLDEPFDDRAKQNHEAHAKRREDMRKRMDEFRDNALDRQREFIERHVPGGSLED